MSTSVCWELTCDGLVPPRLSSSLLVTVQKLEISAGAMGLLVRKGFNLSLLNSKTIKYTDFDSVISSQFDSTVKSETPYQERKPLPTRAEPQEIPEVFHRLAVYRNLAPVLLLCRSLHLQRKHR